MLLSRILHRLGRKLRLALARLMHPAVTYGRGCDLGRRVACRVLPGGRLTIGERCVLDHDLILEAGGRLEIGDRTIFGHHSTISAREAVIIGRDCLIAELVSIRDHDHAFDRLDVPVREQGTKCAPLSIGNDVWIGAKATITKGVTIGDQAIIGANAVVTRDIPPRAVAVGIPAKVIRYRS